MGIEPTMPLLAQSIIGFEVIWDRVSAGLRRGAILSVLDEKPPLRGLNLSDPIARLVPRRFLGTTQTGKTDGDDEAHRDGCSRTAEPEGCASGILLGHRGEGP